MKRYSLLLLPLVAVVFAVSCRDTTSPAGSHALLAPRNPAPVEIGNKPPPPVDAAIVISVASPDVLVGEFTGVYFANGANIDATAASIELGDELLGFLGTAWLRLNNTQTLGSLTSANARFQVTRGLTTDPNFSGRGTLTISDPFPPFTKHTITIDRVTSFAPNPDCLPGALCATIVFDASIDGQPGHQGTVQAFDREVCTSVFIPDDTEEGGGHNIFFCPFGSD